MGRELNVNDAEVHAAACCVLRVYIEVNYCHYTSLLLGE